MVGGFARCAYIVKYWFWCNTGRRAADNGQDITATGSRCHAIRPRILRRRCQDFDITLLTSADIAFCLSLVIARARWASLSKHSSIWYLWGCGCNIEYYLLYFSDSRPQKTRHIDDLPWEDYFTTRLLRSWHYVKHSIHYVMNAMLQNFAIFSSSRFHDAISSLLSPFLRFFLHHDTVLNFTNQCSLPVIYRSPPRWFLSVALLFSDVTMAWYNIDSITFSFLISSPLYSRHFLMPLSFADFT